MSSLAQAARRLVFSGKQQVTVEEFSIDPLAENEVRVATRLSLMSTGTENIVFNRLFDPDTHWDKWVKYPFYPGYINVGRVEAVGEKVDSLQVGDRVAFRVGHRSHANLDPASCCLIPQAVGFEQAAWFALAKIAYHGALAADHRLGDHVLVVGAGPIGQMAIRWARAAGAAVIVVIDPATARHGMALAGGATLVIDRPIDQSREEILLATGGRLPRVVIDSTGNAAVFAAALALVADRGKVVLLGDTGRPAQQTLTLDVITRGLTIVGVHDSHNTPEWNNATIPSLFFNLVASGRFNVEGLTTHVFRPEQGAEAYAVANRDRSSTMGILFDWEKGPTK